MVLRVLVSGLLELDSGKTWTVIALAKHLRELGLRVSVFKPVAGHNLWGSVKALKKSIEVGMLVGNDVTAYMEYLGGIKPGPSNPIALALAYPDPLSFRGVAQYLSMLSDTASMLVLARVYDCKRNIARHYVFVENVARLTNSVRRKIEDLAEKFKAVPADPRSMLESLSGHGAVPILEGCREVLEEGLDVLIIESFNNAVAPYTRVVDLVDFYIIVAPGRLMLYSGDRLRNVYGILGGASRVDRLLSVLSRSLVTLELPLVENPTELAQYLSPVAEAIAP